MGIWEWDAKKGKYVPEGTLAKEYVDTPKDLMKIGTRYDHWVELLEEFRSGIVALDTIQQQYKSKADEVRRRQLNDAIELIEKQLERYADYDRKIWDMGRTIRSIPKKAEETK